MVEHATLLLFVRCARLGWTFRRARSGTKGGVVRFRPALDSESVWVTLAALDRACKLGQTGPSPGGSGRWS